MVLQSFIVFEGLDGSGTSTQLKLLQEKLVTKNVWFTAEPTDKETGLFLRKMLKGEIKINPKTSAFMFATDRCEHLNGKDGVISQCTEELVGPYDLHDFFLYYFVRWGFTKEKIKFLAHQAFDIQQREKGKPTLFTKDKIDKWIEVFYRRFYSQQFKRSCLPDGVKIGSVGLSPRGDWIMPSDAILE